MTVERIFWWLPRPPENKYVGGFPRYFEKRLLELLNIDPKKHKILHPFGGGALYGDTVELIEQKEFLKKRNITPTFWGDAHDLSFIEDNSYDLVICDPPYSNQEAEKLYGIKRKLQTRKWISEAVRVVKIYGHVALYHKRLLPNPKGCNWKYSLAIATRINHVPRLCGIFSKDGITDDPKPTLEETKLTEFISKRDDEKNEHRNHKR